MNYNNNNNNNKLSFKHNVTLTVSLTVGTPPQSVTMVLDTGSELSWLHCKQNPNKTLTALYNPQQSSSYNPIPCSSQTCRARTRDLPIPVSCDPANRLCHVILSYADATSLEGTLSLETFGVGSTTRPETVFGCMDVTQYSSDSEEDARSTGLMGLNRGSLSFSSQMSLPRFSYCISSEDETGVLVLGGLGSTRALRYTPLVRITTALPYYDRAAYTVQLEGIMVAGKVLPIPKAVLAPDHTGAGQTMVDSGTQFTFLLGQAYSALKAEFARQTEILSNGRARQIGEESNFVYQGAMDLCYRVPAGLLKVGGYFPAVGVVFGGGAEMVVPGERAVVRAGGVEWEGGDWVYCMSFGNAELVGIEAYIIGHYHQQNVWMEFDLVNSRLGFADVACHVAAQQSLGLS